jgi:poly(3-hydroxyalkanoate) synthetase
LGGTLLAMAAAALANTQVVHSAPTTPLASMTLSAEQLDFRDAAQMGVLLDEAQYALLKDIVADRGFLGDRRLSP